MRGELGKVLIELAEKDTRLYLLVGDIGYGVFDEYRKRFPDRFLNIGIREQAMVGIAAGMALEGLQPWVYTITPFLTRRPFEQVTLDIDQQDVNVKLVGYANYPEQGPTHQEPNAREIISLFKNIRGYFPESTEEARKAILESYFTIKPTFISLK